MENVGALSFRGLDAVLGSLAEIGYDAEWQDIRASDVGAPHRRERIWIVAYPHGDRLQRLNALSSAKKNQDQEWFDVTRMGREICDGRGSGLSTPWFCGKTDGVPSWMDRLERLGNAIVPQIAELIFAQSAFDEWRGEATR